VPLPQQNAVPAADSAHVWNLPALIRTNGSPLTSSAVVATSPAEVGPDCPSKSAPQHTAEPLVVSPQVWSPPALIDAKDVLPDTAIGTFELPPTDPLPSCPELLSPQQ